jgi:hypothetical protein
MQLLSSRLHFPLTITGGVVGPINTLFSTPLI